MVIKGRVVIIQLSLFLREGGRVWEGREGLGGKGGLGREGRREGGREGGRDGGGKDYM